MADGQPIEDLAVTTPIKHQAVHQGDEAAVRTGLEKESESLGRAEAARSSERATKNGRQIVDVNWLGDQAAGLRHCRSGAEV